MSNTIMYYLHEKPQPISTFAEPLHDTFTAPNSILNR